MFVRLEYDIDEDSSYLFTDDISDEQQAEYRKKLDDGDLQYIGAMVYDLNDDGQYELVDSLWGIEAWSDDPFAKTYGYEGDFGKVAFTLWADGESFIADTVKDMLKNG